VEKDVFWWYLAAEDTWVPGDSGTPEVKFVDTKDEGCNTVYAHLTILPSVYPANKNLPSCSAMLFHSAHCSTLLLSASHQE
jgi:hypothetical protein